MHSVEMRLGSGTGHIKLQYTALFRFDMTFSLALLVCLNT